MVRFTYLEHTKQNFKGNFGIPHLSYILFLSAQRMQTSEKSVSKFKQYPSL
jgi:hypothetical protein